MAFTEDAASQIERVGSSVNVIGTSDLREFAEQAISRTNVALEKSGIHDRFSLAGIYRTGRETGRGDSHHARSLISTNDDVFDDVHMARERVRADVVTLIYSARQLPTECGMVLELPDANGGNESVAAFAVVHWLRAIDPDNNCFAHEAGHLLGATHAKAECNVFFAGVHYPNRRSIMGHPSSQCPLSLPFYSWANVLHMSKFIPIVSRYMDSTPPVRDIAISWHAISPHRTGANGFVRIENRSDQPGTIELRVIDGAGVESIPFTLNLKSRAVATVRLTNIVEDIGKISGAWSLHGTTTLDVRSLGAFAYGPYWLARTDILIPAESDVGNAWIYRPMVFNPGSNQRKRSALRIHNPSSDDAEVEITARDDDGRESDAAMVFTIPGGHKSRTITATELESVWGDGYRKWRPEIRSSSEVHVINLIVGPDGYIASLP